jgi:LAGLIDADG DNA endonuclease family
VLGPNGIRSYSTSSENCSELKLDRKRKRDIGNPKYTNQYKANKTLTPFQTKVLIGLLLGDLHISQKSSIKGWHRLTIRHSMVQYDYLQHLHELLEDFVVQPILKASNLNPRTKKTYYWCNLHTLSFPCFGPFRALFYNDLGIKIIPADIGELLTPVGLAYWLSDDGHYHKAGGGLYLYSVSFTL